MLKRNEGSPSTSIEVRSSNGELQKETGTSLPNTQKTRAALQHLQEALAPTNNHPDEMFEAFEEVFDSEAWPVIAARWEMEAFRASQKNGHLFLSPFFKLDKAIHEDGVRPEQIEPGLTLEAYEALKKDTGLQIVRQKLERYRKSIASKERLPLEAGPFLENELLFLKNAGVSLDDIEPGLTVESLENEFLISLRGMKSKMGRRESMMARVQSWLMRREKK